MPLPKISVKDYYPDDRDEFYLRDDEYFSPDSVKAVEEMLGIYGYMGIRPDAYQIGHRFYHKERRQTFIVRTPETLEVCKMYAGIRIMWLPTLDDIIRQVSYDGIRISVMNGGIAPQYVYRTFIFDPLFPDERGYHPFRHASYDPWVAFAFPIAKAYKRRFEHYGIDTFSKTIYTTDKDFADNPLQLVDQSPEINTRWRGIKKHDRQNDKMEGKTRR